MNISIFSPENNTLRTRPDTTIARNIPAFYIPEYMESLNVRAAIGIKMMRAGKAIKDRFAHRYFDMCFPLFILDGKLNLSAGVSPTTDMLDRMTLVPLDFIPFVGTATEFPQFEFKINGDLITLKGESATLKSIHKTIEEITRFTSIKKGDMIIIEISDRTELSNGDTLSTHLENNPLIETEIHF